MPFRQPSRDFRVSLSSFLPNVLADKAWIEKVLANLLGNAVKYSPPDQPIFVAADPQKTCSPSASPTAAPASTRWSRA